VDELGYEIRVGTPMEGVVITVERRQFPEAMDWEDGNWLISPIRIAVLSTVNSSVA
jgi:hypothetical protein